MKIKNYSKSIFLFILVTNVLWGTKIEDYVDYKKCNKIIDKKLYSICYSYNYKGPIAGWVKLDGEKVNFVNIKKRPHFYSEKNLPLKYRAKSSNYRGFGKKWNRGHTIVSDADFDYSKKALAKAYTMANITPQAARLNQISWAKLEKYGRILAKKLGYINSITLIEYKDKNRKIKNNITIPTAYYRIYYNDEKNFKKCFYYKNKINLNWKNDKIKNHVIDCGIIEEKN